MGSLGLHERAQRIHHKNIVWLLFSLMCTVQCAFFVISLLLFNECLSTCFYFILQFEVTRWPSVSQLSFLRKKNRCKIKFWIFFFRDVLFKDERFSLVCYQHLAFLYIFSLSTSCIIYFGFKWNHCWGRKNAKSK